MTSPPLVTLITPSFNQGRFLRRTIDSVLEQTYPHIQYLVLDGGSSDETIEILRSYGRKLWWLSETDRGQAHAINKGLTLANGELLGYLNSDDTLIANAVETWVDYFAKHPDWDLIYGRAHYIDESDNHLGYYPTKKFQLRRLAEECCICQPSALWRREMTQRIGLFNEDLNFCLDYEYWLRAALNGCRLVYVQDILACSRLHGETKTNLNKLKIFKESIDVCRRLLGTPYRGNLVGYWHHLCHENPGGWLGCLAKGLGGHRLLAECHYWAFRVANCLFPV